MIIRVKHVFVLVFVCLDFRQLLLHFIGGNSSMSERLWIKMNEKMLKGKTEFLSMFFGVNTKIHGREVERQCLFNLSGY